MIPRKCEMSNRPTKSNEGMMYRKGPIKSKGPSTIVSLGKECEEPSEKIIPQSIFCPFSGKGDPHASDNVEIEYRRAVYEAEEGFEQENIECFEILGTVNKSRVSESKVNSQKMQELSKQLLEQKKINQNLQNFLKQKNAKIAQLENQLKKNPDQQNSGKVAELERLVAELKKKLVNKPSVTSNEKDELLSKIKQYEEEIKQKDAKINDLFERVTKLTEKNSSSNEKITAIHFLSQDQTINQCYLCSVDDLFTTVESYLYKDFPQYKKKDKYFLISGQAITVERFDTIKENNLISEKGSSVTKVILNLS